MKFKLILLHESDLPDGAGFQSASYILGSIDEDSVKAALDSRKVKEIQKVLEGQQRAGAPGRSVLVREVEEDVHLKWVNGKIDPLPKNFNASNPVTKGQIFASALECSRHLGFNYNEVSYALAKVAGEKNPGDRLAEVRGVLLQYEEDWDNTKL